MKYLVRLQVDVWVSGKSEQDAMNKAFFVEVTNQYGDEYPVKECHAINYVDEEETEEKES